MKRYTQSGSVYEVEGGRVRRVLRSPVSAAERVGEDWRTPEIIRCDGIGHPLVMVWGTGRDEHSAKAVQLVPTIQLGGLTAMVIDGAITRMTQTTPVVEIEVTEP